MTLLSILPFYIKDGPIRQERRGDTLCGLTAAKRKKRLASACPQNLNSKTKIKHKDTELGKLKEVKKKKNQIGSEAFQLWIYKSATRYFKIKK